MTTEVELHHSVFQRHFLMSYHQRRKLRHHKKITLILWCEEDLRFIRTLRRNGVVMEDTHK